MMYAFGNQGNVHYEKILNQPAMKPRPPGGDLTREFSTMAISLLGQNNTTVLAVHVQ